MSGGEKNNADTVIALHSLQHAPRMLEKIQQRGATMAFWNKKQNDFETMDEIIQQQPGISQTRLAQQLEVERSTVARRLPSMEEAGYLYYEDDGGGLWSFKKQS